MPSPPVLVPFDPNSIEERQRLLEQRKICGWGAQHVDKWFTTLDSQPFFWIHRDDECVGHASLQRDDWETHNDDLCSRERHIIMLSKLFVLAKARGGGFGTACVRALEAVARNDYGARRITIHTMPDYYSMNDAYYASKGSADWKHHDFPIEAWYSRLGYTKWAEDLRYKHTWPNGEEEIMPAVYMWKDL